MKLLELHLKSFGPFTDRRLALGDGEEGLHVVFGRNEAGKTSALRALTSLLYGIDERTRDDFLHDRNLLRVGARLRGRDGSELVCYRRKGRKNTLLDELDKPIPEGELLAMLGGVDAGMFEQLFGIDHAGLVKGGQSLLDERGREAEALFGAGVGGAAVHDFLAEIESEADTLFRARGSKPLLNSAIAELAEFDRQVRDASLAASSWDAARRERNAARRELTEAEAALKDASRRRSKLERVRRSLPRIAQRVHIMARLAEIGAVPLLPDDFGERRVKAVETLNAATERHARSVKQREELKHRLDGLSVNDALRAEEASIEPLRERLGSYRKAMLDRPELAAERDRLTAEALARLSAIRPDLSLDAVDGLRPLLRRQKRVATLAADDARLTSDGERVTRARTTSRQRVDAARLKLAEHPQMPDPGGLREALAVLRRSSDPDLAVDEAGRRLGAHDQRVEQDTRSLGRWSGAAISLLEAPLPVAVSIRLFDDRFTDLDERQNGLTAREDAIREQLSKDSAILETLRRAGSVPSEAELASVRERRNQAWRWVREHWQRGLPLDAAADEFEPDTPLPQAYEAVVTTADLVADRLRREAESVHQRATAQARAEAGQQQLAEVAREFGKLEAERAALSEEWRSLWSGCGLEPATPREMTAWLERAERLRALLRERAGLVGERERQLQVRCKARASLLQQLEMLGGAPPAAAVEDASPLAPSVAIAERHLDAIEDSRRKRQTLDAELERLEREAGDLDAEAATLAAATAAWQEDWATICSEFGTEASTVPEEAIEHLQVLGEIVKLHDQAADVDRRVAAIDGEAQVFADQTKRLLETVAPDLLDASLDAAVRTLSTRLREQVELGTRIESLTQQLAETEAAIREAGDVQETAGITLSELCRSAECDTAQLAEVESKHRERLRMEKELQAEERELRAGGDGLDLDALLTEAGSLTADEAASELANLVEEMEQLLQPRVRDLAKRLSEAEQALAAMRGGDEASVLAERAQQQLATVRHLAERYLRARVASLVLRDEMERFRQAHRDPILERASGYFSALTASAFTAVETSLDADDQPVLLGQRGNGDRLTVEAMSTGTRDQLYLALRLATLEKRLEGAEPLPFIVDDILIQFDDPRTFATLGVLAEFSRTTQVVLFTHHGQVADRAREISAAGGGVFVHALED